MWPNVVPADHMESSQRLCCATSRNVPSLWVLTNQAALTNNTLTKHNVRLPSLWQSTGLLTNWKGKRCWGLCRARREGFLSHLLLKCKTLDFSCWYAELLWSGSSFLHVLSLAGEVPTQTNDPHQLKNKIKQNKQTKMRWGPLCMGTFCRLFLWTSTESYYTFYACSVGNVDKNFINSLSTQGKKMLTVAPNIIHACKKRTDGKSDVNQNRHSRHWQTTWHLTSPCSPWTEKQPLLSISIRISDFSRFLYSSLKNFISDLLLLFFFKLHFIQKCSQISQNWWQTNEFRCIFIPITCSCIFYWYDWWQLSFPQISLPTVKK